MLKEQLVYLHYNAFCIPNFPDFIHRLQCFIWSPTNAVISFSPTVAAVTGNPRWHIQEWERKSAKVAKCNGNKTLKDHSICEHFCLCQIDFHCKVVCLILKIPMTHFTMSPSYSFCVVLIDRSLVMEKKTRESCAILHWFSWVCGQ